MRCCRRRRHRHPERGAKRRVEGSRALSSRLRFCHPERSAKRRVEGSPALSSRLRCHPERGAKRRVEGSPVLSSRLRFCHPERSDRRERSRRILQTRLPPQRNAADKSNRLLLKNPYPPFSACALFLLQHRYLQDPSTLLRSAQDDRCPANRKVIPRRLRHLGMTEAEPRKKNRVRRRGLTALFSCYAVGFAPLLCRSVKFSCCAAVLVLLLRRPVSFVTVPSGRFSCRSVRLAPLLFRAYNTAPSAFKRQARSQSRRSVRRRASRP